MANRRSTGLVDRLNGLKTNLLTNGSFTSNATGWTAVGANIASTSNGSFGNCLSITNSAASPGQAYQDIATKIGSTYRLDLSALQGTSGNFLLIGTTSANNILFAGIPWTDVTWTDHSVSFIALSTTTRITLVNTSGANGAVSYFDELNLFEIWNGFGGVMNGCLCNIYTTSQPVSADNPATGILLSTVSRGGIGSGLIFTSSVNGVVNKPSADIWKGSNNSSGTAGWYRFYLPGDDVTQLSTLAPRLDGTISISGGGGNMIAADVNVVGGLEFSVTGFNYTPNKG